MPGKFEGLGEPLLGQRARSLVNKDPGGLGTTSRKAGRPTQAWDTRGRT